MQIYDRLTGYVHEVPDGQFPRGHEGGYGAWHSGFGEADVVYDRLGNPVGFGPLAALLPGISSLVSPVISKVVDVAKNIFSPPPPPPPAPPVQYQPPPPASQFIPRPVRFAPE